jgi:hypothetical protein
VIAGPPGLVRLDKSPDSTAGIRDSARITQNKGDIVAGEVVITPVANKAERAAFVDLAYRLNAGDPNWVPPLRMEAMELITPGKNPFFEHADVQLFLARRDGRMVGRISAHIDHLAVAMDPVQGMGPGTGNWGLLEAEDEAPPTP